MKLERTKKNRIGMSLLLWCFTGTGSVEWDSVKIVDNLLRWKEQV